MSTFLVKTAAGMEEGERVLDRLVPLLPGVSPQPGDAVTSVTAPGLRERTDEISWTALLSDPAARAKRKGLSAHIDALLELDAHAKEKGLSLADSARERAETYRRTLESAWVTLLEQNRAKEEAIRWCHLFYSNMGEGASRFHDRIFVVDALAEEVASETGRKRLADELSHYVDRPDPRKSRAYLVVQGWVGNSTSLHALGAVAHGHRAILVGDAPSFDTMDKLRGAAEPGRLLEELAGERVEHRHMMLVSNKGRARRRFVGRHAEEKSDVFIPLSGPWFGMYLERIASGQPWRPPVGYQNRIAGIDGVLLDLRLKDGDGFKHYLKHRLNPALPLSAGSQSIVVWGPDALSKADGGVQMGVAVVEMMVVRYAEWVVNQYGLHVELDEAEEIVRKKLSEFVIANSGAGRMFRAGSRVEVVANQETRSLHVNFNLQFREVAERAEIRLVKPQNVSPGEVSAKSLKG